MIEMARRNQPVVVTPFTLAGAMAPVTIAGALVQQNAEALAGIALLQIVEPGAPVIYGGFTSNVDMRSGAPAFGTPEYVKAALIGGQLARRYGLPYRSSNVNASNWPDAQATYESAMSIWASDAGPFQHAAARFGWLEGGLARLLREGHPGRRDAADDGGLPGADRADAATSSASTPCARSAPAAIIFRPRTPWRATRTPSTSRSCRTGAISRPGRRTARRRHAARQPDLEAAAGRIRGAAHGPGDPRGVRRVHRPAQEQGGAPSA